jgi:hypothetical protein
VIEYIEPFIVNVNDEWANRLVAIAGHLNDFPWRGVPRLHVKMVLSGSRETDTGPWEVLVAPLVLPMSQRAIPSRDPITKAWVLEPLELWGKADFNEFEQIFKAGIPLAGAR